MMSPCPQGEPVCTYQDQFSHTLTAAVQHVGEITLECDKGVNEIPGYWRKGYGKKEYGKGEYLLLIVCNGAKKAYRVRVR